MPTANHEIGATFDIHFVWKLPDNDYLRAIFQARIEALDTAADRYIIRLADLRAGRQESPTGEMRPREEMSAEYWGLVRELEGRKAAVAYEADDGRPLHLRLPTLTREHQYFTRFDGNDGADT